MPPYNYCAVDGCKSQKSNRSLSFFSLPVDETRRIRWLEVIGRPDLINPKTNPKCHFVCSLHFEKYMITSKPILKSDAEPIKFLPNQPNLYNTDRQEYKEASTQTMECNVNDFSAFTNEGPDTFPEVPIIKQENSETYQSINTENIEVTVSRIKQEYTEAIEQEDIQTESTQMIQTESTQTLASSRKTKQPRKARKRKQEKDSKHQKIKKKPAKSSS